VLKWIADDCVLHTGKDQFVVSARRDTLFFSTQKSFDCDKCSYGAVGLLFYVLAELFPLVLVFAIIMMMKLKLTSGPMQSILLFAQTITFVNQTPSLIALSEISFFLKDPLISSWIPQFTILSH
jgi:hypothetical protein